MEPPSLRSRFRGILLGTAVGDALGLPAEGLSRRRVAQRYPRDWGHRLCFGRGLISDDTEHTIFVAQSLLEHPTDASAFARRLARSLRWWMLSLPAGIGLGTLRAVIRLWFGVPPGRSGVASAGNGPAMRVAPLGAFFADQPARLEKFVAASTRVTHSDPRALTGALAVARVTAWCTREAPASRPALDAFLGLIEPAGADEEWTNLLQVLRRSAECEMEVAAFAEELGLGRGVTGYVYHTVPVVLYAWYQHFGDFRATVESVLRCGGDADTTGAIAGALAGVTVGDTGIPPEWIHGVRDWPRGIPLLRELADALTGELPREPVRYSLAGVPLRNLFFLTIVLTHGVRRLWPG